MKIRTHRQIYSAVLALAGFMVLLGGVVSGQIAINAYNVPYSENFNSLAVNGASAAVPSGWAFIETGGDSQYLAGTGSDNAGGTYSFGTGLSTERAFGQLQSNTVNPTLGAAFTNTTGAVITSLTIEYTGEQWRLGALGRPDSLKFQFSINASSLTTGTWTDYTALDFIAPVTAGTVGALDGNSAPNYTLITQTLTGLSLANGSTFWIRWVDSNAAGSDDGLAVDDFSIMASDPCPVSVGSFLPSSGPAGTVVTISGSNFTGASEVYFNNIPAAAFVVVSNSVIIATVPPGATSGFISVLNVCLGSGPASFTVIGKNCSDTRNLIISELCDPQNNYQTDRFIEIYNPTGATINLANWEVRAISSGSVSAACANDFVSCWPLSGTLGPNLAITCGYTTPVAGGPHTFPKATWITTDPDQTCSKWNGQRRDGAALYFNGTRIDGIVRENTSTDWYPNSSLVRNPSICSPSPNSSSTEWAAIATATAASPSPASPRVHSATCAGTSPVVSQLLNQTCCVNGDVTLAVNANSGTAPYTFQWKYYNTVSGNWEVVSGSHYDITNTATTSSLSILSIPISFNGQQLYCEVSNNGDICYQSSNAIQLTVYALPVVTASSNSPLCQGSGPLNFSGGPAGMFSYAWTGPSSFANTTQNPSIANPSPAANGTYYLTVIDTNNCTSSASTVVSVTALPAAPTLTTPLPCVGAQPVFTAGNGSLYEFFRNSTSQGPASVVNTYTPSTPLVVGDQVCVQSLSPFVLDGNLTETGWGTPLATSAGGPNPSGFGAGNNIDALYLQSVPGYIYGGIAGNLVSTDRVLLFIDCQAGGYNNLGSWSNRTNAPYRAMENLNNGITFDTGFDPDYILGINQAAGDVYFDLYNMQGNSNNPLGSSNGSGLLGFIANSGFGDYLHGFEFAIPRIALGSPGGLIKVFAMITNEPGFSGDPTFLSNQFLSRANALESNYGNGAVVFDIAAPNPVSVTLLDAACSSQTCITIAALPSAPTVGAITQPTCALATGSVVLSGLPSGNWTLNPGAITGSTTSTTLSGLTAGNTYNFTVTNASGCTSSASANIILNAQPTTPVVPAQTAIRCSGVALNFMPANNPPTTIVPVGTMYTWANPGMSGGMTGGSAQAVPQTSVNQTLINPTNTVQTAVYTVTPIGPGCTGATFLLTVTVNPAPLIPAKVTMICSGTPINYIPVNNAPATIVPAGTLYTWSLPVVTGGITGGKAQPVPQPSVNDTLTNPSATTQTATYTVTPIGPNCSGTPFQLTVTVNPKPILTTFNPVPGTVCSGNPFVFVATSLTPGTTFSWTRAVVEGISNPASSGITATINETLINTTTNERPVKYIYTLSANGCTNPIPEEVIIVVVPAPVVIANSTPAGVCPGLPFDLYSSSNLGTTQPAILLSENFETGVVGTTTGPNGWTTYISAPGNVTQWTIRQSEYTTPAVPLPFVPVTISSNTNDKFYLSDNTPGKLNPSSSLMSPEPGMNTTGYTTLTLDFWDYYRDKGGGLANNDYAYIDVSTDNFASVTTIKLFDETHGLPNKFAHETVNLSAFIDRTNVRIRFRFEPTNDYYWAIDNVKVTGTSPIQGFAWSSSPAGYTNTLNVSPTGVTQTGTTTYIATYTDLNSNCAGSNSVTVTNYAAQVEPTISAGGTICQGGSWLLTCSAASAYQWNMNGSPIIGQTAQTYTATVNNSYTVTAYTANGCFYTSAVRYVFVNPVIANNTITADQTICSGGTPAALTGSTPTGGNGTTYNYLWESSTTSAVAGFTTAGGTSNTIDYTPGALAVTTWFRRTVTSGGCTDISITIQITVNPLIANNTIAAAQTICSGSTPAALTGTMPTGGDGTTYNYLWESSTSSAVAGFVTASGTSNTIGYVPGALAQTTWYRRNVTSAGCTGTSAAIAITITPLPITSLIYHF